MRFLNRVLRGGLVLSGLGAAVLAILAFLGFAVPAFDLFNHLQPVLFFATLGVLALSPWLLAEGPPRSFMLTLVATGFIASASTVIPEALAGLAPREPVSGDDRPMLTLMTHNLFGSNYDMQRVVRTIFAEDPDIVALQEFFPDQSAALHPLIVARYPYFATCQGGKRANIAVYAKLPFTQIEDGACADSVAGGQRTAHIIAVFTLPDQTTFTVVNTHLDWPLPLARQRAEFTALSRILNGLGGPLLLVGDFNSTPWSYALRWFVSGNRLTRHTHNLVTFPLRWWYLDGWNPTPPFLPLDHVMTRGEVAVHELHLGPRTGSDHLPVAFAFSVTPVGKQLDCCPPDQARSISKTSSPSDPPSVAATSLAPAAWWSGWTR